MTSMQLNYKVPITSAFNDINKEFFIEGIAINSTVTANGHKFESDELRMSAQSLQGVPLLVDHRNEVDAIMGRVINGEFSEVEKNIKFKALVKDQTIKAMIQDGRLDSVSVGASVEDIEESEEGFLIPRGITFKELSLVAVPADSGATFSMALTEAYKLKSQSSHDELELKGGSKMTKEITKELKETEEVKDEAEAEVKPEVEAETKEEAKEVAEESVTKSEVEAIANQVKSIQSILAKLLAKDVKESDVDENPEKEVVEDKPAEAKEESEEESKDEADEEEEEEVSESYNVVKGYKGYSVIRNSY